jgi:hypothetical protein
MRTMLFNGSQTEGDIFFGTTIIYPGKVGSEYHLTRGRYHSKRDHAETYQALSGSGFVFSNRKTAPPVTLHLRPARSPIFRPIGPIARSTRAMCRWFSFGRVPSRPVTTTLPSGAGGCDKWSLSGTASQSSWIALPKLERVVCAARCNAIA